MEDEMKQEELDEIRKLCEVAHVGPWEPQQFTFPQAVVCGESFIVGADNKGVCKMMWPGRDTAEFIARSRTVIPELLDEIENLQRELSGIKSNLNAHIGPSGEHPNFG
jgi:hypothetical protein